MKALKTHTKKVIILIIGVVVGLIGLVLLFYPGPGILVIFASLAILSTEFSWAHNILKKARHYYDFWLEWLKRSNWAVRLGVASITFFVVVLTIWIFNGYGLIAGWVNLDAPWLRSPLL